MAILPPTLELLSANPRSRAARAREMQSSRTLLSGFEVWMHEKLQTMPVNDALRIRLQHCENSVIRQQRARNPDTLLKQQLLAHRRWFLNFFGDHPEELAGCRRFESMNEQKKNKMDFDETQDRYELLVNGAHRLMTALLLASFLWAERGGVASAVYLQIVPLDLLELLRPGHRVPALDVYREKWAKDPLRSSEKEFELRRQYGYRKLSCEHPQGAVLAIHDEGALFLGAPDSVAYDIDLSLLTADPTAYPNPRSPAQLLQGAGFPGCRYIDLTGRQREVAYDTKADTPVMIE